ncbi:hypothetical protein [Massilia sp. LjRoot122]|uniref:hypothetical protein n=1 Tax=Massilia sp. LjRoot122 TaxID=3342257 RepID=UPI003ECF38F4
MIAALHGSSDMQSRLLARLGKHEQAKSIVPSAFAWTGEKGSLVGCLLESPDASQWESELGLPQWLAVVADKIAQHSGDVETAAAFGARFISAISPGADLEPLGSQFILRLLGDLKGRIALPAGAASEALAEVERLHHCVATKQPVTPQDWRAARRAATAATDEVVDAMPRALSTCAETAAWNPATSPAAVYDVLRTWAVARKELAALDAGWRPEYEPTLRAHLKELFDKYLKDKPELQKTLTVFELLAEHYPEDDRLVRLKNGIDRDADKASYPYAANILLELLQAA